VGVARVAFDLFGESSAGAIVTAGDPATGGRASTVGVDLNLYDSHARGSYAMESHLFAIATDREGATGDPTRGARRCRTERPPQLVALGAPHRRRVRSRAGFVSQTGVWTGSAAILKRWRLKRLDRVELSCGIDGTTDLDGHPDHGTLRVFDTLAETKNEDSITLTVYRSMTARRPRSTSARA